MSKFLKFLVNTFLIAAIFVAAAILIPPIAGVTTTIVDTTSMETNLPLGSITYSTGVDVSDLKVGDEVLKDNDISTYAYVIRSGDETTGRYQVVSATDPEGREEEIYLRNKVSKVAVVIPYIGYIMIAMHSIEGIIIIALVVILMIILFILSELWKPRDDEDSEEDQEAVVSTGLSDENENGIDTDTVRAAMEANVAAVSAEDGAEEIDESTLSRAERRALRKARKQAEKEARNAARQVDLDGAAEGGDAVDFRMPTDDETAAAAEAAIASVTADMAQEVAEARGAADELKPQVETDDAEEATDTEQIVVPSELEEDAAVFRQEIVGAETGTEPQEFGEDSGTSESAGEESGALERSGEESETPESAGEESGTSESAGEDGGTPESAGEDSVIPEDAGKADAKEDGDVSKENASDVYGFRDENIEIGEDDLPVIDESVLDFAEETEAEDAAANVPELEKESDIGFAADSPVPDYFGGTDVFDGEPEIERFTPTKRPTLSEMLDQAKDAGEDPEIIEDKEVGVTMLDYSDLI